MSTTKTPGQIAFEGFPKQNPNRQWIHLAQWEMNEWNQAAQAVLDSAPQRRVSVNPFDGKSLLKFAADSYPPMWHSEWDVLDEHGKTAWGKFAGRLNTLLYAPQEADEWEYDYGWDGASKHSGDRSDWKPHECEELRDGRWIQMLPTDPFCSPRAYRRRKQTTNQNGGENMDQPFTGTPLTPPAQKIGSIPTSAGRITIIIDTEPKPV